MISKLEITEQTKDDLFELEGLFYRHGELKPVSYELIKSISQNSISVFCLKHGIYQLPTTELIDWLKNEIKDQFAIEIGAGNGSIGNALGIPITDSKMQEKKDVKAFYDKLHQPTVKYHPDIVELDGNTAVEELNPQVVVACWVTQLYKFGLSDGNQWGVDEIELCKNVQKYIHVGNDNTHSKKEVLTKFNFERLKFDWLVSRSMDKQANSIYIYRENANE